MKEWFTIKYYPHIGMPLTNNEKKRVVSYIKNADSIKSHSFLPFIHKTIHQRKLRKEYDIDGNLLYKGARKLGEKNREIYYANHFDANIYAYYSFILNKRYEKSLKLRGITDVVTAYRRIPKEDEKRNKNNIDFANDIFNYIRENSNNHLIAIAFDITSFFDNLKHSKLKKAWCDLFDWEILKEDHYNIFKNITKFSYVEENDLFNLFKNEIIVKTKTGIIKKKKIDKLKYLYKQKAIAYCELNKIHLIRKKGLIKSNKYDNSKLRDFGICQGSPISATLANIYLLDFDEKINNEIKKINGIYRRYSDDMVVICPANHKQFVINLMTKSIQLDADLEINTNKTQIFHFIKNGDRFECKREFNGRINKNSDNWNFEYLGFAFDGKYTYLKTASLAKFYRKMKLNTNRTKYYAKVINNDTNGQIFKRRLYKRFSYIGSRRKLKYVRKRNTTNEWVKTHKYNWGNYITYAKLAIKTLDNNKINSQIKRHWKILNKKIEE